MSDPAKNVSEPIKRLPYRAPKVEHLGAMAEMTAASEGDVEGADNVGAYVAS